MSEPTANHFEYCEPPFCAQKPLKMTIFGPKGPFLPQNGKNPTFEVLYEGRGVFSDTPFLLAHKSMNLISI